MEGNVDKLSTSFMKIEERNNNKASVILKAIRISSMVCGKGISSIAKMTNIKNTIDNSPFSSDSFFITTTISLFKITELVRV